MDSFQRRLRQCQEKLFLHIRICYRGTSGQDRRSGLRCYPRFDNLKKTLTGALPANHSDDKARLCGRRDNDKLLCRDTLNSGETIKDIGYTRAKYGFDYETCAVITSIHEQSGDIAMGVTQEAQGPGPYVRVRLQRNL